MKTIPLPCVLLPFLLLVPLLQAAQPNQLTSAESAAGWKLLFDGQTLQGWRGYKAESVPGGWAVRDGAIARVGAGGDIMTVGEFGDFELVLEWKVTKGANSGIIYRVGLGDGAPWHSGPEYQILDNIDGADRVVESHRAASLYDLVKAGPDVTKPVGEWNVARIVVRGWRVEHWLNGQKLVDVDLGSAAGRELIAGSKFKPYARFAALPSGHLVLQDHGDEVYFRSIKIRELK